LDLPSSSSSLTSKRTFWFREKKIKVRGLHLGSPIFYLGENHVWLRFAKTRGARLRSQVANVDVGWEGGRTAMVAACKLQPPQSLAPWVVCGGVAVGKERGTRVSYIRKKRFTMYTQLGVCGKEFILGETVH